MAAKEVDQILTALDIDKNGSIDINEFKAAAMDRKTLLAPRNLRKAFDDLDRDGSGKIWAEELQQALGGSNVDEAVWKKWLTKYSSNPTFLDRDDFYSLVSKRTSSIKKTMSHKK